MNTAPEPSRDLDQPSTLSGGRYHGEALVWGSEEVVAQGERLIYRLTSQVADADRPDVEVRERLNARRWRSLQELARPLATRTGDQRVGDPDGADGGGEYLTVTFGDRRIRLDYEPRHVDDPPAELETAAPLARELRRLRQELSRRHHPQP